MLIDYGRSYKEYSHHPCRPPNAPNDNLRPHPPNVPSERRFHKHFLNRYVPKPAACEEHHWRGHQVQHEAEDGGKGRFAGHAGDETEWYAEEADEEGETEV
jgi:hypothetical protein